ncbi:pilin [Patescibacteria group bacterium]|nr:pilin [Patescibacteria group bacterium]MBU1683410.1 pilin [Patescibacteria group bacterium]MBU1934788.1 pilin [Patescibacteria group bacterium]
MAKTSFAQSYLGEDWDEYLRGNLRTFVDTSKSGEDLAINFVINLVVIARYMLGALALIMGTLYGMALIFARGKEDAIEKQKKNFTYVFIGFILVIAAENIANIFNPETSTSAQIIDYEAARDQLRDITDYIKYLLGSVIVLIMTISSIRLITAGGDEEMVTKQKKNLAWGLIGMMIILLASNIVNAIYVINTPTEVIAGAPEAAITEITSVIQLILVFLGPIAIIFTIYAGFMYLTAMDQEEGATKAKNMIIGGITGIVIIYSAYALINTVISSKVAQISTSLIT